MQIHGFTNEEQAWMWEGKNPSTSVWPALIALPWGLSHKLSNKNRGTPAAMESHLIDLVNMPQLALHCIRSPYQG